MPNTPILNIAQVSASQNQKEVTINDAILALENATNRKLVLDYTGVAGSTILLSDSQTQRNFIFEAKSAPAAAILRVPNSINGQAVSRLIVVRNISGQQLTVRFATGTGTTVIVPDGQARLIAAMDGNVFVAAEPATVASFLSLTDTPSSYASFGGKVLAVKADASGLEFISASSFPALAGNGSKVLAVKADGSGVEWVNAVTNFLALTDTPVNYTGAANKFLSVKASGDGIEFVDAPEAEAVEYTASAKWRVRAALPGADADFVAWSEVEFYSRTGIGLTTGGTPVASSFDVGREPTYAFDNDFTDGTGWFAAPASVTDAWVGYEFTAPVDVRSVKLWAIPSFPQYSPTRIVIERWNGTAWIACGEYVPDDWATNGAQTFKVLGASLTSVPEAPSNGNTYGRENGAWVDIAERIRDVIGAALVQGSGISITTNDAGDTITLSVDNTSVAEMARDALGSALVAGTGITITPDDDANTITISATGGAGGSITVNDEGTLVVSAAKSLNFVGTGVTVAAADFTPVAYDFGDTGTSGSSAQYNGGVLWFQKVVVDETGDISSIIFNTGSARTGTNLQPYIYADDGSGNNPGARLGFGPVVANSIVGDQVLPLSASVRVTKGTILWLGTHISNVGNITGQPTLAGTVTKYWIGDTSPPPTTAPGGLTNWSSRLRLFARGTKDAPAGAVNVTIGGGGAYRLAPFFTSTPTSGETLFLHAFSQAVTFADDFAGSIGRVGTNPAATFTMTINKNGAAVGTITVSTTGTITFATTGTALSCAAGDVLSITAPATADAAIANCALTLVATQD